MADRDAKTFADYQEERGLRDDFIANMLGIPVRRYRDHKLNPKRFSNEEIGLLLEFYGIPYAKVKF